MGARTRRLAYTEGKYEQRCWRYPVDCGRSLSMVLVQGHLPSAFPRHPSLSPLAWRFSSRCLGRFEARSLARRSLCWMLLGFDDVVVCWWRDERVFDGGYCDASTRGKNRQRAFFVAHSRRWPYRRRLVANAAYVRCRSCANSRGAHSLVRVTTKPNGRGNDDVDVAIPTLSPARSPSIPRSPTSPIVSHGASFEEKTQCPLSIHSPQPKFISNGAT